MDQVFIQGLAVEAVIGVYDWEREIRQRLLIDLQLATDIRAAAANDDLSKTLDYKAIADRISDFVGASRYQLLETLAEDVAQLLLSEFGVKGVKLRIAKPGAVPEAQSVGVEIERSAIS